MGTERVGEKGGYILCTDQSEVTGVGRSCHLNLGCEIDSAFGRKSMNLS